MKKLKQIVQPGMDILSIDYLMLFSMGNLLSRFESTEITIYNCVQMDYLNYELHLRAWKLFKLNFKNLIPIYNEFLLILIKLQTGGI